MLFSSKVEITVDDTKVKPQLASTKSNFTKTIDKMKASVSSLSDRFKKAFTSMVRIAKWGAVALAGAFVLVAKAAMKQEDVEKRLAITLKATGHAAGYTKNQLLEQASALQQVTRFGDETITAMQTMLLTFKNIKGDEFKRATEAALDMATAEAAVSGRAVDLTAVSIRLGKALNDPILGMSALSKVGVAFTDVQKDMIKEMVEAGDVAGAQSVILKELEGQFGGMSRDVDTASGALRQMWNVLGDVAEIIGKPLLQSIKDTSRNIKKLLEDNKVAIGDWADRTWKKVLYAKNAFVDFVIYLKEDWKAATKMALDMSLETFKLFGKSLMIIMGDIFTRLYSNISVWTKRAIEQKRIFKQLKQMAMEELGRELEARGPLPRAVYKEALAAIEPEAEATARRRLAMPVVQRRIREEYPLIERDIGTLNQLKEAGEDYLNAVKGIATKATEFSAIRAERQLENEKWMNTQIGNLAKETSDKKIKAANNAGIAEVKVAKMTAEEAEKYAEDKLAAYRRMYDDMDKWSIKSYNNMIDLLKKERDEYILAGIAKANADEWMAYQKKELDRERAIASDDIVAGFSAGIDQMKDDTRSWGEFGEETAQTMKSSMSDTFMDMTTDGANLRDFLKGIFVSILKSFRRMVADMVAEQMMQQIMKPAAGWIGRGITAGLQGLGAWMAGPGVPTPAALPTPISTPPTGVPGTAFAQHGGDVMQTGFAVVHKRERILSADETSGKAPVVNITVNSEEGIVTKAKKDVFQQGGEWVTDLVFENYHAGGKMFDLIGPPGGR